MDEFNRPAIQIVAEPLPAYREVLALFVAVLIISDLVIVDDSKIVGVILPFRFFQVNEFVHVGDILKHQLDILVEFGLRT